MVSITFVTSNFPAVSQPFIEKQIFYFIEKGFPVAILARNITGEYKTELGKRHNVTLIELTEPKPISSRIKLFFLCMFSVGNFLKKFLKEIRLNYKNAIFLRTIHHYYNLRFFGSTECLHIQFASLLPEIAYLRDIGLITAKKIFTSCRGRDITAYTSSNPDYYSAFYEMVDIFLPVSVSLRNKLIDLGCPESKIQKLYTGIEIDRFPFLPKHKTFPIKKRIDFLSVGRLVEKKGHIYSIQAIKILLDKGVDSYLTVVGAGPARDSLLQEIEKLNLSARVKLIGAKPHDEVIELMKQSDIFILPSVTSKDGDSEGIPNAIKEAMLLGVPVVSTLHGGIGELEPLMKYGLLSAEGDTLALTAAIENMLSYSFTEMEMILAEARSFIENNFSSDKINARLLSLYSEATVVS